MKKYTNLILICFALITTSGVFADSQALTSLKNDISGDAGYVMDIVNRLMIVVMILGVIYIAGTLVAEKSINTQLLMGWFAALIIWITIRIILGFATE